MNQIPLYGHYPAHHDEPTQILELVEHHRQAERKRLVRKLHGQQQEPPYEYILLPWTMSELPDTTWRNVYTFGLVTIQEVRENKWGKPGPDPDPWINSMFAIGLWRHDRYEINHWVRVGHLSIKIQMQWHLLAVTHQGQEVMKAQATLKRRKRNKQGSCWRTNVRLREHDVARAQKYHQEEIAQMKEFAALHHLSIPNAIELTDLPLFALTEIQCP